MPATVLMQTQPKDLKTNRSTLSAMSSVSNASNFSTATKKTFDRDDVEKLNHYLDENLMPNDPTSRLSRNNKSSRGSNISNATSIASTKTLSSIHEKPWKPC